jgi:hypothetical protein
LQIYGKTADGMLIVRQGSLIGYNIESMPPYMGLIEKYRKIREL